MQSWEDAVGITFRDNQRADLGLRSLVLSIRDICRVYSPLYSKIYQLQLSIFRNKEVVNFIDLLPYNDRFIAFILITCNPNIPSFRRRLLVSKALQQAHLFCITIICKILLAILRQQT